MAEGKQGPALQKAYLWMIGKKRIIGGVFAVVTVALAAAGQPELAAILTGTVAAVFTSAGFIDANWREEPRLDSAWLRFLRDNAINVAALLAAASAALSECNPTISGLLAHAHLNCWHAMTALGVVSAIAAHLGISAEAQAAPPPVLPR